MAAGTTVKAMPLLVTPSALTTTGPLVAALGTGTKILVFVQPVGDAVVPLNVTVPGVVPKFAPVIATVVPMDPDVGATLVMVGNEPILNVTPLLARPATATTTGPVVAPLGTGTTMLVLLQLLGVAAVPLNFTVLVPWVAPKFVPVIVTDVPTGPELGERLLMLGGTVTVNVTPLLARPATVTTTGPVVAPLGTGTTMLVLLQLLGVAVVPLNFTVLVPWVGPKFVPVIVTDVPTGPELGERLLMLGGNGPVAEPIDSSAEAECVRAPSVPTTVSEDVPIVAAVEVVIVIVALPTPAMDEGVKLALAPVGSPETLSETVSPKPCPPIAVAVTL
jgi:hypothetical protein